MATSTWDLVREERLSLARTLAALPDDRWSTPTLCTEWTVHHVLAHLVMTASGLPTTGTMAAAMVRARGHLWHAARDVAVAHAQREPHELVATLRHLADARTKPVFVVTDNILVDLVVHGQDVAVPLGLDRPVPDDAARPVLERLWSMGWPWHADRRLHGVRLEAGTHSGPDLLWTAGEGPVVAGAAGDLALLMSGRTSAALSRLRGPGVALLVERLGPAGTPELPARRPDREL